MKKIYIDCGTHLAEGLKKHISEYNIGVDWEIYTFEANPFTYELLQKTIKTNNLPEKYNFLKWTNIVFENKAVSNYDGTCDFYCSEIKDWNDKKTSLGFSEFSNFHDSLVESGDLVIPHQGHSIPVDGSSSINFEPMKRNLEQYGNTIQKSIEWTKKVNVNCFDLSSWIKSNFSEEDFIICKIDIEGSEFDVLEKCIDTGVINYFNILNVEFHHYGDTELVKKYNNITNFIKNKNIEFNIWN